jgi:hypothetical protein
MVTAVSISVDGGKGSNTKEAIQRFVHLLGIRISSAPDPAGLQDLISG